MTKTYCATDDASTMSYEELKADLARLEAEIEDENLAAANRAEKRAERRLAIETCHQVKENGALCRSAAVSGRHYCYFHLRHRARRLVMARARARGQRWRLQLPALEDLPSVQVALMQVLDAVTDDSIDSRRAGLLLYGLQQAATNLRARAEDWEESNRFESDEELEYANFEAEFDLPQDLDLATPPEVAFPPPEEKDVEAPAAPDEFEVTPLDVELTDSNAETGAQRVKQASNAEVRRQQQRLAYAHRTALAEARQAERRAERIEAARARWAAEAAAREQAAGASTNPKKAPQAASQETEALAEGIDRKSNRL